MRQVKFLSVFTLPSTDSANYQIHTYMYLTNDVDMFSDTFAKVWVNVSFFFLDKSLIINTFDFQGLTKCEHPLCGS